MGRSVGELVPASGASAYLRDPPQLTRLRYSGLKGLGTKFIHRGGSDVGTDPASGELQGRGIGPLPIRQHEIRPRLSDNYLFAVEFDLNVHDRRYPVNPHRTPCVRGRWTLPPWRNDAMRSKANFLLSGATHFRRDARRMPPV